MLSAEVTFWTDALDCSHGRSLLANLARILAERDLGRKHYLQCGWAADTLPCAMILSRTTRAGRKRGARERTDPRREQDSRPNVRGIEGRSAAAHSGGSAAGPRGGACR